MFESKSKAVKIGGYIIIGFFSIIVIISFGVPDFMSRLGMDTNTVAIVNGEKIHYLEYLKFRDNINRRYRSMGMKTDEDKEHQKMILNGLIYYRLQLQKAKELGITVSDDKVKKVIKEINIFKDKSGKFNNEYLKNYLHASRSGFSEFFNDLKEKLIVSELEQMIKDGVGISPEEIIDETTYENSRLQIKYCFVSNNELKKRLKGNITVTDAEIDEELKKNKSEIKDPKTDRERIKTKIENRKMETAKKEIIDSIDKMAIAGKSFNEAAAKIGGSIKISNEFKIGEPAKEVGPKGKVLHSLSNSNIFKGLLSIEIGTTSRVINSIDGIYIFTPTVKNIKYEEPKPEDKNQIENRLLTSKYKSIYSSIMNDYIEKSRITKNLKLDK